MRLGDHPPSWFGTGQESASAVFRLAGPVCLAISHQYLQNIIKMTVTKSKAKQKVAIVGSGMAGLVTAYLLHNDLRERYSVTIFESVRMSRVLLFAGLTRFH